MSHDQANEGFARAAASGDAGFVPRPDRTVTQTPRRPPRKSVRLHRERDGSYTHLGSLRIARTADGIWEITAIYDGWRDGWIRQTEQAIAFHGGRWRTLAEVREVLPQIASTRFAIEKGRFDPRDWGDGES